MGKQAKIKFVRQQEKQKHSKLREWPLFANGVTNLALCEILGALSQINPLLDLTESSINLVLPEEYSFLSVEVLQRIKTLKSADLFPKQKGDYQWLANNLKQALLLAIYNTRMKELSDPTTTPISVEEMLTDPLRAIRRRRATPRNGEKITVFEFMRLMGANSPEEAKKDALQADIEWTESRIKHSVRLLDEQSISDAENTFNGRVICVRAFAANGELMEIVFRHSIEKLQKDSGWYGWYELEMHVPSLLTVNSGILTDVSK